MAATPSRPAAVPPAAAAGVAPTGRRYAVAAPVLAEPAGEIPGTQQRTCTPALVTVTATSARAADGVLGLVTVTGRGCSLRVDPAGLRLLDRSGRPLRVARGVTGNTNPPGALGAGLSQAAGSVHVGFAWTGASCVPSPVTVELPALPGPVRAPLSGSLPDCHGDRPAVGTLVPGIVGGTAVAVEPPPSAWRHLRVRLVLPPTVRQGPVPASLVVSDVGTSAVTLSAPCPAYAATATVPLQPGPLSGASSMGSAFFGDLCDRGPLVVPAGRSLSLPLRAAFDDGNDRWRPGGRLAVTWAMAGVPTAAATALIR